MKISAPTLKERFSPRLFGLLLKAIGIRAALDRGYRRNFYQDVGRGVEPWRASIGFKTRDQSFARHITIDGRRVKSRPGDANKPDAVFIFRDLAAVSKLLVASPEESIEMLLRNELIFTGNMTIVSRFSFLLERLLSKKTAADSPSFEMLYRSRLSEEVRPERASSTDNIRFVDDIAFSEWTLSDFPRLKRLREKFFSVQPSISVERPRLLTEYFKQEGFEQDRMGAPRSPLLRQAEAFRRLMQGRAPIIAEDDLIGGTTTDKEIGVLLYPDTGGLLIWPELYTMHARTLNPYTITESERRELGREIFPYWMNRNIREVARTDYNEPKCMSIDERFALYFQWKPHGVSHTIPDFPSVLSRGLKAIADEAAAAEKSAGREQAEFYRAVGISIEGVLDYAEALSRRAQAEAEAENSAARKAELLRLAEIFAKVPAAPAETLDEAINSVWITWIACHMENTNTGLSLGRLDVWLNSYLESDLQKIDSPAERRDYLKKAIELFGCFMLRCGDHLPLVPDIGNKLFGGSSSDQAITVGGVLGDGSNAVCDMTYVILKAGEMLRLRDPNLNARFYPGVNSEDYLRRLCEVNEITGAAPSIHGDVSVIAGLEARGVLPEHARDWAATGCVEPTSSGRHYGHTGSVLFNLVAPLELALYNGRHPLVDLEIGPRTGDPRSFESYEMFRDAFIDQLRYLAGQAVECNNMFGKVHGRIRPIPFLSSIIEGPLKSGRDLSEGGALYNSSGVAIIGLADVVDSLAAIRKLVFEKQSLSFDELLESLSDDFVEQPDIAAMLTNKSAKFGGPDPEAEHEAKRLVSEICDIFEEHENYRGGRYRVGFWSMSNHVAFGVLSGALPSGRHAFTPFTPGITPAPGKKSSLTDHIRAVAVLDPIKMPNNIAFNVKVTPAPGEPRHKAIEAMTAYAKSYFELGGMQMQFNVVSTETMKKAMENPTAHRDLMVRISGYNAYFVELDRSIQLELISRAEHSL